MGELHTNNGPVEGDHGVDTAEGKHEELLALEYRDLDVAGELPEELPRGLVERLEDLHRRLGRCEGYLELSRAAEDVLRKQLKRESERADRLEDELGGAKADLHAAEADLLGMVQALLWARYDRTMTKRNTG